MLFNKIVKNRDKPSSIMKLFIYVSSLMLLSGFTRAQSVASLETCIDRALKNNLQVRVSEYDLAKTQATIQQTKSALLPQISAGGSYLYYFDVPQQLLPGFIFGGQPGEYIAGALSVPQNTNASVQLQQTLYNRAALIGLKAAKALTELNQLQVRATREDLIYNLTATYYNIQALTKQLELSRATLVNSEKTLTITQNLVNNSLAPAINLSRLTVNRDNQQTQIQSLENDLVKAYNLLKYLMNVPLTEPLTLTPFDPAAVTVAGPTTENVTVERRTDWQQLQQQIGVATIERQSIRAGNIPTVSLSGSYGLAGFNDKFNPFRTLNGEWYRNSSVTLQINIPLFDGYNRRSQLKGKDIDLDRYRTQAELTRQTIQREVADAVTDHYNNRLTLTSQERTQELAQKVYADFQFQYRNGLVSLTDVLNAETDLINAQNGYVASLIGMLRAELNLKKATGTLLPTE